MRNPALLCASLVLPVALAASCALETPPATTGAGGAGGVGVSGAAGTIGMGGMAGTTAGGMGGTAGTAGTFAGGMGGMAGTAGTAGTFAGGMGGTAGTAGMGGMGGTAGDSMGGMGGVAGMGGTSGAGGTAPALTLDELVGDLDGRLIFTPCTPSGTDDCSGGGWYTDGMQNNCQNNRLDAQVTHEIGGTPGQVYNVTFHFYGVMEPKNYGNQVQREAQGRPNLDGNAPYAWAVAAGGHVYQTSDYNTYEIRVSNESDMEVAAYYLNADTQEGHYTMLTDYEKTIELIGGGSVLVRVFDQNCRMIKNCGASGGTPCADKARTVDISAADPQPQAGAPPSGFTQPGLGQGNGDSGQWVLIDALSFEEAAP